MKTHLRRATARRVQSHLEAMKTVVKGAKKVKSELYQGLLEHQQKEIQTFIAASAAELDWGSKKAGRVVHAMSMQLSTGQQLPLPDCAKLKTKPGAPQGKRKRETDGGSTGPSLATLSAMNPSETVSSSSACTGRGGSLSLGSFFGAAMRGGTRGWIDTSRKAARSAGSSSKLKNSFVLTSIEAAACGSAMKHEANGK